MQALNNGEADCISAVHKDADLWVSVWSEVDECIEEGFDIRLIWTKAHTTHEEQAKMTLENRTSGVGQ